MSVAAEFGLNLQSPLKKPVSPSSRLPHSPALGHNSSTACTNRFIKRHDESKNSSTSPRTLAHPLTTSAAPYATTQSVCRRVT